MTLGSSENLAAITVPETKVSPDYLHGNSSVHTWVFGAMAELIDNSYDANSKEIRIDIEVINGHRCLTFVDNGDGMDMKELFDMLSLGYCRKFYKGRGQIGQFGIGFKSGSMRLGDSALVFTTCHEDDTRKAGAYIGFLSQTYLKKIKAVTVQVPMLEYSEPDLTPDRSAGHFDTSLEAILQYSPYKEEKALREELKHLGTKGTKIVIFELKKLSDGSDELDITSDPRDILCPHEEDTPKHKYSLREYCSILFLRPRMKMVVRGERVKTNPITSSLSNTWTCTYKATGWQKTKVTFGRSWKVDPESDYYGMMLYHGNRLITAFEKLRLQKNTRKPEGVGIIGVTQVNFLDPVHTKQDFIRDKKYELAMSAFSQRLKEYLDYVDSQPVSDVYNNWVQCDYCLKWRKLPLGYNMSLIPEKWFCVNNPDEKHNDCSVKEEEEEEAPKIKKPKRKLADQPPDEASAFKYMKLTKTKTDKKSFLGKISFASLFANVKPKIEEKEGQKISSHIDEKPKGTDSDSDLDGPQQSDVSSSQCSEQMFEMSGTYREEENHPKQTSKAQGYWTWFYSHCNVL